MIQKIYYLLGIYVVINSAFIIIITYNYYYNLDRTKILTFIHLYNRNKFFFTRKYNFVNKFH